MVRYFVSVVNIIPYKPGEGESLQPVLSCVAVIAVRSSSREYLFSLATVETVPHFVKKNKNCVFLSVYLYVDSG
jgi:hypothetical protein